jgi:hypothetical protein
VVRHADASVLHLLRRDERQKWQLAAAAFSHLELMVVSLQLLGELTPDALVCGHPGLYTMEQLLTGGPAFQVRRGGGPWAAGVTPSHAFHIGPPAPAMVLLQGHRSYCMHALSRPYVRCTASWPLVLHLLLLLATLSTRAPPPRQALLALLRGGMHELDRSDSQGEAGPARRQAVLAGLRLINIVMRWDMAFVEQTARLQTRVRCTALTASCSSFSEYVEPARSRGLVHLCAL